MIHTIHGNPQKAVKTCAGKRKGESNDSSERREATGKLLYYNYTIANLHKYTQHFKLLKK